MTSLKTCASLLAITLLATGCSAASPATNNQPGPSSTTSPPTTTTSRTEWSTYTDPGGRYSIQYPNSLGNLRVPYVPNTSTGYATEIELTWDTTDFYVYIGLNAGPELQRELTDWHLVPQQTITLHHLTGTLYTLPGWEGVDERAFVTRAVNGSSTTYEIDFNGGLSGDQPLPSFWRQMLESFQAPAS